MLTGSVGCGASSAGAAASLIFVTTKVLLRQTCVCCYKTSFVMTKVCLSRQNFCRGKHIFIVTKLSLEQISVVTNIFLSQKNFCCDKKGPLSQQKYACCDKTIVATNICLSWQTYFVTTNIILSWQNLSQQVYFCHDKRCVCYNKTFVRTKMILVAAPASDRGVQQRNNGFNCALTMTVTYWLCMYVCIYMCMCVCFNCILFLYFLMGCVLQFGETAHKT